MAPSDFDIGRRLRGLRETQGLSQRELAKRAGVSNAIISLIEQNRTSPSVGLLKKILDGLPLSLSEFFADRPTARPQFFFRAKDLVEIGGGRISYRQVGRDMAGRAMQILHERYAVGADTGSAMLRHDAEEGAVVIQGSLEVVVGSERQLLGPGDAYYFDSRLPHRFRNLGDKECVVVSANSPPSF